MNNSRSSQSEWIAWGERDPLWAVATEAGREKSGTSPWTKSAFYEAGDADWSDFRRHWKQYGLDENSCLEIGCGAGRVTKSLAKEFCRVVAVDVSPGMISASRESIPDTNITFILVANNVIPVDDASVSSAFSTHVFQHLDDEAQILAYFSEVFRVLAPGGSFMIHVPLTLWPNPPRLGRIIRFAFRPLLYLSNVRAAIRRALRLPLMRMSSIRLETLQQGLQEIGFTDIEFRIVPTSRNQHLHAFTFGRKPQNQHL